MVELPNNEKQGLDEIPHPPLPEGPTIDGGTKVFPNYQFENGEVPLGKSAHRPEFRIELAADPAAREAYYALRTKVFVHQQGLFTGHDRDDRDDDPRTVVLVARDGAGTVLGGARLGPADAGSDLGWWSGGRLVADPDCRVRGVGGALVRAVCAHAESAGVLRFEATVQARNEVFFRRLGWTSLRPVTVFDAPHVLMRWPIGRIAALFAATKQELGPLLSGLAPGGAGYLGGHTQLGVPAALSVTALGRTARPVRGGGGRPGHRIRLTVDIAGSWRPGYGGLQWDSSSHRRTPELRAMPGSVAGARPAAAKDVSMVGMAGALGMLAEASGCRAVLDVAAVPRPPSATVGDWLTCFPRFGMLTAHEPGQPPLSETPAVTADCGELQPGCGVALRWPDGELTEAITGAATGLGRA